MILARPITHDVLHRGEAALMTGAVLRRLCGAQVSRQPAGLLRAAQRALCVSAVTRKPSSPAHPPPLQTSTHKSSRAASSSAEDTSTNSTTDVRASSAAYKVGDRNASHHDSTFSSTTTGHAEPVATRRPQAPQENILRKLFASWQQGVVASIGAFMGIGFLIFLFYAPVKEDTVHHTAVVASEALADVRLREQALDLSKSVVMNVLSNDSSLTLVKEFVLKLLAEEDTRIAISSLLRALFEDHYTQEVTKKFVLTIVRDPWIQEQIQVIAKEQVLRLLANEEIKGNLSALLIRASNEALRKPELQNEAARSIRRSLISAIKPW